MGGTYGIGLYIVHVIKEIDFFSFLVNGVVFFKSEKHKLSVLFIIVSLLNHIRPLELLITILWEKK